MSPERLWKISAALRRRGFLRLAAVCHELAHHVGCDELGVGRLYL